MRIACLQYAPELGETTKNIDRAYALLEVASPENLDLLVLPELAFSGYNFPSLPAILPYLEPTASGLSSDWARTTAAKHNCIVTVGYPELYTPSPSSPVASRPATTSTEEPTPSPNPTAYNSNITVSPTSPNLSHYRKTHLYYTDETWALPSPTGWLSTALIIPPKSRPERTIQASFGICMDLNPHQFTAPWSNYEFASHALSSNSELLILSMAWLTNLSRAQIVEEKEKPDPDTLNYWIARLQPLIMQDEREVVVVCCNRCGEEPGRNPAMPVAAGGEGKEGEEGVRYAGSSWVGVVGKGEVRIWGIMGRGEEGVLVVDTEEEPGWVVKLEKREEGE